MKALLNSLYEHHTLSKNEAREVLLNIAFGNCNFAQIASFMSIYLMRPITVDELTGFRSAMLELCTKVKFDSNDTIDIVGTGGDNKNTFNISTLSCFVVAGAGIKVTKHGNYAVSSVSGSSNVLEAIGYKFSNDSSVLQKQLDTAGVCFLHAPLFHSAMKMVAPVRKDLAVRTFFNVLGPLINPCMPKYQLLGVYNLELARLYNYVLQTTSNKYTIVHSFDGYDEVSLTSNYKLITKEKERIVDPDIKFVNNDLHGGNTIEDAKKIFLNVLNLTASDAQMSVVIANAAIAIHTYYPHLTIGQCTNMAFDSLHSKRALDVLKKIIN